MSITPGSATVAGQVDGGLSRASQGYGEDRINTMVDDATRLMAAATHMAAITYQPAAACLDVNVRGRGANLATQCRLATPWPHRH